MIFQFFLQICTANTLPSEFTDVDKTLTFKEISEYLQKPLYSIRLTADGKTAVDADLADPLLGN